MISWGGIYSPSNKSLSIFLFANKYVPNNHALPETVDTNCADSNAFDLFTFILYNALMSPMDPTYARLPPDWKARETPSGLYFLLNFSSYSDNSGNVKLLGLFIQICPDISLNVFFNL